MPICIYCVRDLPDSSFRKKEHVLPDSFGRFDGALTLKAVVCDECNQKFGDTIDLYLARDTPDGLIRFFRGHKKPKDFKSRGRKTTMEHKVTTGPLAGASLRMELYEGELVPMLNPQIGFGRSPAGPFEKWYSVDALPSKEEAKQLLEEGLQSVEFVAIQDVEKVLADLRGRGMQMDVPAPSKITSRVGKLGVERIETMAILADAFGRAIAKIGMNYLASQYGSRTALMPQFNVVRGCIHEERPLPKGSWRGEQQPVVPDAQNVPGHAITVGWDPESRAVVAHLSFHDQSKRYRVVLSHGSFSLDPPLEGRGHFFNLSTKKVQRLSRRVGNVPILEK